MLSRRTFTRCLVSSLPAFVPLGKASTARARSASLFDGVTVRSLRLSNRMVMAPMTRGRAGVERTANALMAQYYAQRAAAGLIVTEGTAISEGGYGWVGSPGIYTDAQASGWRVVTAAVHERGGRIFLQLWHTGRVSHPDFLDGRPPVAPSAVAAAGHLHTPLGKKPYVTPRELTREEIAGTVLDYARATRLAREAGFDGVEIHAANGYLIDQFIRDGSNRRTDAYGGSVPKRLRFLVEVTEAVAQAWSPDRVGVRLSPAVDYNDMKDTDPVTTFSEASRELGRFGLAYLHVVEYLAQDSEPAAPLSVAPRMRALFHGPLILNGGYSVSTGAAALESGAADLIAYGRWFLANADLIERFRRGATLNSPDPATYYTDGARGYTDYPTLDQTARPGTTSRSKSASTSAAA